MPTFHFGFLSGSSKHLEYELWSSDPKGNYVAGIDTSSIDDILGDKGKSDFRSAPFMIKYDCNKLTNMSLGYVICGFDGNRIKSLARIFNSYMKDYLRTLGICDGELDQEVKFKIGKS